jgi:hypothetical protein
MNGCVANDGRPAMNVIANTAWNVGKPMDGDPIITIANQVENIKTLAEAEDMLKNLIDAKNFNFFAMGGCIVRAQELFDKSNCNFKDYTNFRAYLEEVYGIRYTKAMHAAGIYRKLRHLGVPWSAFGNIGWTKVVMLLDVVTKDNVQEWVANAKEMNTRSLKTHVAAEKHKGAPVNIKSFKLHQDQKELLDNALDKIKSESGTEVDAVALEYLCQNYLGAGIQFQN